MRRLFLSLAALAALGACTLIPAARAQSAGNNSGGGGMQLPVGQVFKQFEFPDYEQGVLKATLYASQAKGITLNRIQTTNLTIQVYENGVVTTTVTSPNADLYLNNQINEQKMRTKNTVQVERSDLTATSQDCDFDLKSKKYLLRTNVKVILKHFDISASPANGKTSPAAPTSKAKAAPTPDLLGPISPNVFPGSGSFLESPGAYSATNSSPLAPSSSDAK